MEESLSFFRVLVLLGVRFNRSIDRAANPRP